MRSVPAGSFHRLSSLESLWSAYKTYRRGKRRRSSVAAFDLDADSHIVQLHRVLNDGTYQPGSYRIHVIRDPKTRLIAAPPIRDRVLHQALVDEIKPYFEAGYIHDSYACCAGRGGHRGVLRYLAWTRRYSYLLKLDVSRYFPSIHRPTLHELICRRLRLPADRRTQELFKLLVAGGAAVYAHPLAVQTLGLDDHPLPLDSGLPIGSYLSQWCASLYLDALDHFVKRNLRIRGYLRFMDDMALFADQPSTLEEARHGIAEWLRDHRRLSLNPKHQHVLPTSQASTFLGYRVSRAGLSPGRKFKRRMKKRLKALRREPAHRVVRSLCSYAGWVDFG